MQNASLKIKKSKDLGFTLIELLIVIAIISILVTAIFIALNPPELFASARNAHRWSEVDSIAKAIRIYELEGTIAGIDNDYGKAQVLGTATSGCDTTCSAVATVPSCLDLSITLASILPEIPEDPSTGTPLNTDYYINKNQNGILKVGACDPEIGIRIFIAR